MLFIDASKDFEKGKNQNLLREEDVDKIIDTYIKRVGIEKYSHLATLEEIAENDYNLNIPRYVDTFEEEDAVDLSAVKDRLQEIDAEVEEINKELEGYFKELGLSGVIR